MRDGGFSKAELSGLTLSFFNWELEEAYRWHSLSKLSLTTGVAIGTFAVFEGIALFWNVGTLFITDPTLKLEITAQRFDLFWIAMHATFFPVYTITACALIGRRRCIDAKGEKAIGALLPEGSEEECPSLYRQASEITQKGCCQRMCCAMALIPPNFWQLVVALSSVLYVIIYTELWSTMRADSIVILTPSSTRSGTWTPANSSSAGGAAGSNECLVDYQKGSILGAAYGMTEVIYMAIGSAVGGLRFPFVVCVQCLIVADCMVSSMIRAGGIEAISLWFWPVFKTSMAALIYILYSRISETMARTAFVQWLRLKNANITAELKLNPFSTRSLTRWLRSPAKGSLEGSSLMRPLADSLLADDFANGVSRAASRASGETTRIGAFVVGDASLLGSKSRGSAAGVGAKRGAEAAARETDNLGRWDIPWQSLDLESKAGSGGSGQVYAALYDGQAVAAKELYSQKMSGALEELSREVSILSRLGNHPNIVGMYGITKEPVRSHPRIFIVMEFVDGGDLQVALERWGAEGGSAGSEGDGDAVDDFARTVLALARQVAAGMRFIHANRVLHLDLKPGNILVAPCSSANIALRCWKAESARLRGSRLKLTDFGLSSSSTLRKQQRVAQAKAKAQDRRRNKGGKTRSSSQESAGAASIGSTGSGSGNTTHSGGLEAYATVPGTPLYMAPELLTKAQPMRGVNESEVIEGFDIATKRDVYAYGILLAAIATGGSPYGRRADEGGAEELTALLGEIAGDGSAGLSGLRPDNVEGAEAWTARLPPALVHIMRACWATKPRDRPSFEEVCGLLAEVAL